MVSNEIVLHHTVTATAAADALGYDDACKHQGPNAHLLLHTWYTCYILYNGQAVHAHCLLQELLYITCPGGVLNHTGTYLFLHSHQPSSVSFGWSHQP